MYHMNVQGHSLQDDINSSAPLTRTPSHAGSDAFDVLPSSSRTHASSSSRARVTSPSRLATSDSLTPRPTSFCVISGGTGANA